MHDREFVPLHGSVADAPDRPCQPSDAMRSASRLAQVKALLQEIEAPTRSDIVAAIERATDGTLERDRIGRIAASVIALYRVAS